MDMIERLQEIESTVPIFSGHDNWKSLYIDYHPPIVYRLYKDVAPGYRFALHRILPCEPGEALLHSHPWPSAIHVVRGQYEMGLGFGHPEGNPPPVVMKLILGPGSYYEMTHPDLWHYVRPVGEYVNPIDGASLSTMLIGPPRTDKKSKVGGKPTKVLDALSPMETKALFDEFAEAWPWPVK